MAQSPRPAPFRARVRAVEATGEQVVLEDGRRVRLQGLSLPDAAVRPAGCGERLRTFLVAQLGGEPVWVFPEDGNAAGDPVDLTAVLRVQRDGPSVNEAALAAGLALLSARTPEVAQLDSLRRAAARAQIGGQGWFARPALARPRLAELPYLNGAVLGLHAQDPDELYHRQLDELAAAGFRHVCLLFSAFLADVSATRIDRDHVRCVRDHRLRETIEYAKAKGMSVMLLPIVLLLEAGEDDWRGTLRPADEGEFWRGYDEFLCHYLDIGQAAGADIFSIGSELGSLEHRTDVWTRLIAHARGRFTGFLSYSANWDHVHVPRFFGQLDVVGMTAYFSLTDKLEPTPAELRQGWREVAGRLERSVGLLGRPVIFTEIGYPSQDGANRDPWNYLQNKGRIDLQEQADCFAAFLEVAPSMSFLRGAYFYDYFDEGGPEDHTYSPRGKPAFEEWRRWAAFEPPK